MEAYSPLLIEHDLKGMVGKELRDDGVKEAIVKHKGMYFTAIGGTVALMSQYVTNVEIIAFEYLVQKQYVS